ncbi:MAG: hypothetical protein AAGI48_03150 [Verrucomicrobiota bacterium]
MIITREKSIGSGLFLASALLAAAMEFEKPVALEAGDERIRVESPGYAAPGLADLDGDGKLELLVGQFRDGKIKVFERSGELGFAEGSWLEAGGEVAKVPGVW